MLALTRSGSSVVLREVPDPVPLSHEAVVRVNAFAVTHRDLPDLAGAWPTDSRDGSRSRRSADSWWVRRS